MGQKLSLLLKSNAVLAIALNLAFLALALCFCETKFEESDDFYLASMLSGAYGNAPNAKIHFVNFIFGFLIKPLYLMFPTVSWFLVIQIGLFFCALTGVTYVLLQRLGRSFGFAVSLFFVAFFSDDLYIVYQWTKSAVFLTLSGFFILLWASKEKRHWAFLVSGGLLMLCGSWIRFEAFQQAFPFMALIYFSDFWVYKKYTGIRDLLKGERRLWITAVIIALVILGCGKIHQQAMSEEGYPYYSQYNGTRAAIMDYSRNNATDFFDDIEEAGFSKEDYNLFKNWIFYDPDIYSLQKIQILQRAAQVNTYSKTQRLKFILASNRPAMVSGYPIFGAFIILLLGVAVTHRRALWPTLMAFLLAISLYVYFIFLGRLLYRLEFGIWLGSACVALWYLKPIMQFRWHKTYTILLIFVLAAFKFSIYIPADFFAQRTTECTEQDKSEINSEIFFSHEYNLARYESRPHKYGCYSELKKELESHPENLYMLSLLDMIRPQYCWFSPYQAVPVGYFKNLIFLGHWTVYWPDVTESLAERGIKNPLKELVKDNVYVVGQTAVEDGKLKDFLMRHYYDSVSVDLVKIVDGVRIYKFRVE